MSKSIIYDKIRDCSKVGFHGWYNSSAGVIRKPNSEVKQKKTDVIIEPIEEYIKPSLLKRIWYWIKNILKL